MKLVPKTKKVTPSPKMKFQQLVMHAWILVWWPIINFLYGNC